MDFNKLRTGKEKMSKFLVDGIAHEIANPLTDYETLQIYSSPRSYTVNFQSGDGAAGRLVHEVVNQTAPILIVDQWIFENYLTKTPDLAAVPRFAVRATEEVKSLETVLRIIDFFLDHDVSKKSMVYAVGGGIIQDLAAFATYMYKRGVPWTYLPTTLLAQADSSVGGKTALNYEKTKNLLALFSAPRRVITDTGFLLSLTNKEWFSGGGEILRLCITGGELTLREFEFGLEAFVRRDLKITERLIQVALSVKKSVVEFDEFEINTRRSMNYGHTFGHALEALTDYKIPHGTAVALGILVENEISYIRGLLPKSQRDRILSTTLRIVPHDSWAAFNCVEMDGILNLLRRDKKSEGAVLKLATLTYLGSIDFIDLHLDRTGEKEVLEAYLSVVTATSHLCDV